MEQACGGSPNQFLQNLYTLCFIFNFKFPIFFFFGHWNFFFLILKSLILTCVPKHFLDSSGQEQKGREKEGSVNLSPDWYSNHLALVFIWYVGCPKCILYLLFVSSSEMQIPPMKTSIVDMATTLAPTSGRLLFFRAHLSPPGTSLGRIALKTIPSLCSTSVRASPSPSFITERRAQAFQCFWRGGEVFIRSNPTPISWYWERRTNQLTPGRASHLGHWWWAAVSTARAYSAPRDAAEKQANYTNLLGMLCD